MFSELARRGHNVTVVSPNADKKPAPDVHTLLIDGLYGDTYDDYFKGMMEETKLVDPFVEISAFFDVSVTFCAGNVPEFLIPNSSRHFRIHKSISNTIFNYFLFPLLE